MGWFDKKSWQLRRKIRDLQSELAVAEREGKYVIEQGLFFAELQEMGESTLMVLGTADHLDSEEDEIVRNFYDRNGFTVETLRLDRAHKTLTAVEIIPPEELTRRVAKILREGGYRLIDDSDHERPSNLEKQTITLSSIIRAVAALFTAHVHQLIISTPLKMNMEGNRLLHWTPLIREALLKKVPQDVVTLCRDPFITAYDHYYGQFGTMAHPEDFQSFTDEPSDGALIDSAPLDSTEETPTPDKTPTWAAQSHNAQAAASGSATRENTGQLFKSSKPASTDHSRSTEGAQALARMYKALIGTSSERRVRNAEVLLDIIAHFFGARAVCLLYRRNEHSPFKLHANAGQTLCLETNEDGTITCDTEFLHKAMASHSITAMSPDGNGNSNPTAVIAPLDSGSDLETILYIVEPAEYKVSEDSSDPEHATAFSRIFREFPDLLLPKEHSENN